MKIGHGCRDARKGTIPDGCMIAELRVVIAGHNVLPSASVISRHQFIDNDHPYLTHTFESNIIGQETIASRNKCRSNLHCISQGK